MKKFITKVLYYGSIVLPIYNFLKDLCINGYAVYINHQQELETIRMHKAFQEDKLTNISPDEYFKAREEMIKRKENQNG